MKLINFLRLRTEALIRLAKKQNNIHIVSKEITSSELKEQKEREKENQRNKERKDKSNNINKQVRHNAY